VTEQRYPPAHLQQARALLVWETGAGFTHAQNILGVARHLTHQGISCVAALADVRFDPWFRQIGCQTLQTYLGPVMRTGFATPEPRAPRVFSDILANQGFFETAHAAAALAHYETLFQLTQPDIVLCENAPNAVLAARKRIPTIIFGSSLMTMPPTTGGSLAPVDLSEAGSSWPQDALLGQINAALSAARRPPLSSMIDLLHCDAMLPFGPAAFDPYAHSRKEPVLAPHCPDFPSGTRSSAGKHIAVYMHEAAQYVPEIIRGLSILPQGTHVFIPSLQPHLRQVLESAGLVVHVSMLPLSFLQQEASCLVHQGGVTLTAAALAMGIPQLVLARFHENAIAGRYVDRCGLGLVARIDTVEARWLADTAVAIASDQDLQIRAAKAVPTYRAWFDHDPTKAVAAAAARILGVQGSND
jgi:hypothetical protein